MRRCSASPMTPRARLWHRAAALKLMEVNSNEKRERIKQCGGWNEVGDTSQNGMWDGIRNVHHNGRSMLGQEGFTERVRGCERRVVGGRGDSHCMARYHAPACSSWTTCRPFDRQRVPSPCRFTCSHICVSVSNCFHAKCQRSALPDAPRLTWKPKC